MTKSDIKKDIDSMSNEDKENIKNNPDINESIEDKLKAVEDKLLRTLAEMENQRRRFEKKEVKLLNLVDLISLKNLCY